MELATTGEEVQRLEGHQKELTQLLAKSNAMLQLSCSKCENEKKRIEELEQLVDTLKIELVQEYECNREFEKVTTPTNRIHVDAPPSMGAALSNIIGEISIS